MFLNYIIIDSFNDSLIFLYMRDQKGYKSNLKLPFVTL